MYTHTNGNVHTHLSVLNFILSNLQHMNERLLHARVDPLRPQIWMSNTAEVQDDI